MNFQQASVKRLEIIRDLYQVFKKHGITSMMMVLQYDDLMMIERGKFENKPSPIIDAIHEIAVKIADSYQQKIEEPKDLN